MRPVVEEDRPDSVGDNGRAPYDVDLATDPGSFSVKRLEDHRGGVHRVPSIGLGHGAFPVQPIS